MIGRVFRGANTRGLLAYLFGPGRRNEHTDAHVMASWDTDPDGLQPPVGPGGRHEIARLARLLDEPVRGCERAPEKYVYHLTLRTAPGDRELSDAEWGAVCEAAMDRTGIAPAGDWAGCRWVAIRHADDHIHLVATLAREDLRAPRVYRDYAQIRAVALEFETRYGLRTTAGRDDFTAAPRPGIREQVTAERTGRAVPPRVELQGKVRTAAATTGSYGQFVEHLATAGVTVWRRYSERDPSQVTGYSVSLAGVVNSDGTPVRWGGGKLAPDLSWPQLQARWADPTSPMAAVPAGHRPAGVDRAANPGGPSQPAGLSPVELSGPEGERVWREAERIVRDAAGRITADIAAGDTDEAADAAWAATDTLAAAAQLLEPDRDGPLTRAAADFERAGRLPQRQTPRRTESGSALRAAGRMVALLPSSSAHPAAQTRALLAALSSLTGAVGDLRQAQTRLVQAEAAHAASTNVERAHDLILTAIPTGSSGPTRGRAATGRPQTAAQIAALGAGHRIRLTPLPTPPPSSEQDSTTPTDSPTQERGPRIG